jgi:hypothetical protein
MSSKISKTMSYTATRKLFPAPLRPGFVREIMGGILRTKYDSQQAYLQDLRSWVHVVFTLNSEPGQQSKNPRRA